MAEMTGIEWTHRRLADGRVIKGGTYNPWIGCTKVSPACDNCYAERDAVQKKMVVWGPEAKGGTRRVTAPNYWLQPQKWADAAFKGGCRMLVFCASWADVWETWHGPMLNSRNEVLVRLPGPAGEPRATWIGVALDIFKCNDLQGHVTVTMDDCRREFARTVARTAHGIDWIVLTKRPAAMAAGWSGFETTWRNELASVFARDVRAGAAREYYHRVGMIPNVWAGATVESTAYKHRLSELCRVPVARRLISYEPAIGPLDLTGWLSAGPDDPKGLHWVITGGESGDKSRVSPSQWYRDVRDQCVAAGVPFFFKQWGEFITIDNMTPDMSRPHQQEVNVWPDGTNYPAGSIPADVAAATRSGKLELPMLAIRVGKKVAGHVLDGQVWQQQPLPVLTV